MRVDAVWLSSGCRDENTSPFTILATYHSPVQQWCSSHGTPYCARDLDACVVYRVLPGLRTLSLSPILGWRLYFPCMGAWWRWGRGGGKLCQHHCRAPPLPSPPLPPPGPALLALPQNPLRPFCCAYPWGFQVPFLQEGKATGGRPPSRPVGVRGAFAPAYAASSRISSNKNSIVTTETALPTFFFFLRSFLCVCVCVFFFRAAGAQQYSVFGAPAGTDDLAV